MSLLSEIPIIDFDTCGLDAKDNLSDSELFCVGEKLYDALSNCGFVYLKNTGISLSDVADVNNVTEQFFIAPLEQKVKFLRRKDNFGYVTLHAENLDPTKTKDYKECFNITSDSLENPEIQWPIDISKNFRITITAFMERCRVLSLRILKTLAVGMKLKDPEHFVKNHSLMNKNGGNHTTLRTIFYPPLPDNMDADYVRLGKHADYGSMTLLFQDDVGGLQIETSNGDFIDAVPIEGTVLINIGDLLQSWSRDKLKSTKHRVVNTKDPTKLNSTRRSMAYFVHPDDHVLVDEELVFKDSCPTLLPGMAEKPGMTALDYLNMKFSQTYALNK